MKSLDAHQRGRFLFGRIIGSVAGIGFFVVALGSMVDGVIHLKRWPDISRAESPMLFWGISSLLLAFSLTILHITVIRPSLKK